MSNNQIKVALLLGGTSPEKEVSKNTAKSILKALRELGYKVVPINPGYGINQPDDEQLFFSTEEFIEPTNRNFIEAINSSMFDTIDVACLALHGRWGEDGTIQSLLELRGIKYTGSDILASTLAMDKAMTKVVIQNAGVSTPEWLVVDKYETAFEKVCDQIKNKFGYPCVIKPNDQGSTVGLTICKDDSQIEDAVKLALKFSNKALIEEYIPGRELTISILEGQALPVLEICPKSGLYDYESKYTAGKSEYICPAKLPEDLSKQLQTQALLAFNAVGCSTYSRIDFRLTDDGKYYCLEINTLPGMTSLSLVPKAAKAAGISFEELVDRIVKSALK